MPAFTADAKRRQNEKLLENAKANANKPKGLEKLSLGNELPNDKNDKSNENSELGKAVVQAIESIAPGQTNKAYVQAALKECGEDFQEPFRAAQMSRCPVGIQSRCPFFEGRQKRIPALDIYWISGAKTDIWRVLSPLESTFRVKKRGFTRRG
jgi:hypothetical protein